MSLISHFFFYIYTRAKVLACLCQDDMKHWCMWGALPFDLSSQVNFKGRWAVEEKTCLCSAEALCWLTSSHPEHEYLSAKCLKCKFERFNKKRLRLCSSAVYGNAGLLLWIIHVSFQTEKFEKLTKCRIFFLLSHIILLWFRFDQPLISAAQSFKAHSLFIWFMWRSIDPLEDQRASVKLVFTYLTRKKLAPYTLWRWILSGYFLSNPLITQPFQVLCSGGNQSTGVQEVLQQKV